MKINYQLLIVMVFISFIKTQQEVYEVVQPIQQEDPNTRRMKELERKQLQKRDNIKMNYEHIQSYTFSIAAMEQFIISVDVDHTIKGIMNAYWEQQNSYVESQYVEGQEIRIIVYEDRRTVLVNDLFYRAYGFQFQAKKDHEYLLRFFKNGREKLLVLNIENYLKAGKTQNILNPKIIGQHEKATQILKDKLKTYLGIIQRNTLINENIAHNVQLHTQRYMIYQLAQIVLVLIATIGQVYFIKKLLTSSSVI